jgi:hypothetical protein
MAVMCVMLYGAWWFGLANNRQEIAPPAIANRVPTPEVVRSAPLVASTMPARERSQRFRVRRNEGEQQRVALAPQLPVPMPLTQQEKLLLAFARENPNEVASTVAWQERMREPAEKPAVSNEGEQQ